MDYRKIIKFGANSHVISLPRAWVDKYKLGKGDTLYVENIGNSLIVSPTEEKEPDKKIITIPVKENTTEHELRRQLISAYEDNATTIIFSGDNVSKFTTIITRLVESYIALEIIEHTEKNLRCKAYIKTDEVNIETFIRRIDNSLRSMIQEILNEFNKQDAFTQGSLYEDISEREKNIDKLMRMLRRVIRERLYRQKINEQDDPLKLLKSWQIVAYLEAISDELAQMTKELCELKDIPKAYYRLIELFAQSYEKTMKIFHQNDDKEAYKNANTIRSLGADIKKEQVGKFYSPIIEHLETIKDEVRKVNRLSY